MNQTAFELKQSSILGWAVSHILLDGIMMSLVGERIFQLHRYDGETIEEDGEVNTPHFVIAKHQFLRDSQSVGTIKHIVFWCLVVGRLEVCQSELHATSAVNIFFVTQKCECTLWCIHTIEHVIFGSFLQSCCHFRLDASEDVTLHHRLITLIFLGKPLAVVIALRSFEEGKQFRRNKARVFVILRRTDLMVFHLVGHVATCVHNRL